MKIDNKGHQATTVTTPITETKEMTSFHAISVLRGRMSKDIITDVHKYIANVNDNSANSELAANISGDQSNLDIEHPLMRNFCSEIIEGGIAYQNFMGRPNVNVENEHRTITIDSCWSVKMNQNDYNPIHAHYTKARTGLATICYIKVPEHIRQDAFKSRENPDNNGRFLTDGLLQFRWQSQYIGTLDDYSPETTSFIIPTVGDYYIFPKWLDHAVYPYRGTEQRWSVQTNLNVYTDEESMRIS
tara:strand:- start:6951 stop:7682 length:732 start_codon:yes stop_codon:yes gene_type:complete